MVNQAGVTLTGKWKIEKGNVINADALTTGFGVENGGKAAGTKVSVDENLSGSTPGQQWERSSDKGLGYFTLKNPNSGKFLSALNAGEITIQSMQSFQL